MRSRLIAVFIIGVSLQLLQLRVVIRRSLHIFFEPWIRRALDETSMHVMGYQYFFPRSWTGKCWLRRRISISTFFRYRCAWNASDHFFVATSEKCHNFLFISFSMIRRDPFGAREKKKVHDLTLKSIFLTFSNRGSPTPWRHSHSSPWRRSSFTLLLQGGYFSPWRRNVLIKKNILRHDKSSGNMVN